MVESIFTGYILVLAYLTIRHARRMKYCSAVILTNEKLISSMYINLYIVRQKYFHTGYLTIERYSTDNETMKSYYKITTNVQILFVKHTNT